MFRFLVSILVLVGASGCTSQRPVLYPNEQFKRVGSSVAERDIDDCMRQAEEYVASNGRTGNAVQGAATGAATSASIGAAAGAAGGAVVGRGVTGAAIGAASGGQQLDPWLNAQAKPIAGVQELRESLPARQGLRRHRLAVNGAFDNSRRAYRRCPPKVIPVLLQILVVDLA